MTANSLAAIVAIALGLAGPAEAASSGAGAVCIRNETDAPLFLVAEAPDGSRASAEVAPGDELCSAAAGPETGKGHGVVGAFSDSDAIEGCSRITAPGHVQILAEYHDFDRCVWSGS